MIAMLRRLTFASTEFGAVIPTRSSASTDPLVTTVTAMLVMASGATLALSGIRITT
jgi:hypothetical protein